VQAPPQERRHRGGKGTDQDTVIDDVREVVVQPQRDAATGQGLADSDVAPSEGDKA
jgi:hypothetical protein